MQVTQPDAQNSCKRVEGKLIEFGPSYLQNMKKFIMYRETKIDRDVIDHAGPNWDPPPEDVVRGPEIKPEVQPPLPLDPPPLHRPIQLVKQEIVDSDYQIPEESAEILNQDFPKNETSREDSDKSKTICRDFIRGMCQRRPCRFAHKYDLNQLVGVYTFCHKFQNSYCTYGNNCKYVHATVFEERKFYRTGILPPHALAHHKKIQVLQPPPPPPEEPPPECPPPPSMPYVNPPPTQNEIDKPLISCIHVSAMEARPLAEILPTQASSSLKRPWKSVDTFGDIDAKYAAKKCKNCDISEFRVHYYKDKINSMMQAKEELLKKITNVDDKTAKLSSVINLLKPQGNENGKRSLHALMTRNLFNTNRQLPSAD